MSIRIFDLLGSLLGLLILSPLFLLVAICIKLDSKGSIFYTQKRVGKGNKDFKLYKFRTMTSGADKKGLLTVGNDDVRITRLGRFLRKYKLDEFPQLINVLLGDMSLVGPRPEVRKYTELYDQKQRKVLEVRPGITDIASIEFSNENELLKEQADPEKYYIENIMPRKLDLNLQYLDGRTLFSDLTMIYRTFRKIF